MARTSWSIDGFWVEYLPTGQMEPNRLEVRDRPHGAILLTVPTHTVNGNWTFPVGDRKYRLTLKELFSSSAKVFAEDGTEIPPSETLVARRPAPGGSLCATEQAPATAECPRCGTFICDTCLAADRLHCKPCVERLMEGAPQQGNDALFFVPALLCGAIGFVSGLGGAMSGALIGFLVGVGALRVARQSTRETRRLLLGALFVLLPLLWLAIELPALLHRK